MCGIGWDFHEIGFLLIDFIRCCYGYSIHIFIKDSLHFHTNSCSGENFDELVHAPLNLVLYSINISDDIGYYYEVTHYSLFMGALIHPVVYLVFIAAAILGFAAGCECYHSYMPKHMVGLYALLEHFSKTL